LSVKGVRCVEAGNCPCGKFQGKGEAGLLVQPFGDLTSETIALVMGGIKNNDLLSVRLTGGGG